MVPPDCHVPPIRLSCLVDGGPRPSGDYVLVWMTAFRRTAYNYTLDRAVSWSRALGKPILVFEPLLAGYPWASDRLHRFVIQGMADNQAAFERAGIAYYPYLEPHDGDGRGLLKALAERAAVVVTDDSPSFFLPRLRQGAKEELEVRTECVDSNGLLPLRAADRAYPSAHSFRRILQRELPNYVLDCPRPRLPKNPCLQGAQIPQDVLRRWPKASPEALGAAPQALAELAIDHSVGPAAIQGGRRTALKKLKKFIEDALGRYLSDRNHPDREAESGLSPYLHFGHISTHEIFAALVAWEDWHPDRMAHRPTGAREGFWGMSPQAEGYLDQAVTWRELGYNMAHHRYDDLPRYASLPPWALETLAIHAHDPREQIYTLAQLEAAQTNDPLWNAAQNQLTRQGTLHNYMRMLWGKRVIAWTHTPQEAFAILEHLNNKYALDGRDPNSYSGILWCFGRYDRPWPERPIFGKIRMMTSASAAKKLQLKAYVKKFS